MSNEEKSQAGSVAKLADTPASRKITIVSTRGEKKKVIEFSGTVWSELRSELKKAGYDLNNTKCVETVRRTTLEHDQAIVPTEDFNLFIMPVKSKSGNSKISRSDVYTKIKGFLKENESKAKSHFGNYTKLSTNSLIELVDSYHQKYKPEVKREAEASNIEAITDILESIKIAKGDHKAILSLISGLSVNEKLDLIIIQVFGVKEALANEAPKEKETVVTVKEKSPEEIQKEKEAEQKAQEEAKRKEEDRKREEEEKEKKRLEDEETERLQKEMKDMSKGFGGDIAM